MRGSLQQHPVRIAQIPLQNALLRIIAEGMCTKKNWGGGDPSVLSFLCSPWQLALQGITRCNKVALLYVKSSPHGKDWATFFIHEPGERKMDE